MDNQLGELQECKSEFDFKQTLRNDKQCFDWLTWQSQSYNSGIIGPSQVPQTPRSVLCKTSATPQKTVSRPCVVSSKLKMLSPKGCCSHKRVMNHTPNNTWRNTHSITHSEGVAYMGEEQ